MADVENATSKGVLRLTRDHRLQSSIGEIGGGWLQRAQVVVGIHVSLPVEHVLLNDSGAVSIIGMDLLEEDSAFVVVKDHLEDELPINYVQ